MICLTIASGPTHGYTYTHMHTVTTERVKKRHKSGAPGRSLEALQPGDTAAAAVVSLQVPGPVSPNNYRSEAAPFLFANCLRLAQYNE